MYPTEPFRLQRTVKNTQYFLHYLHLEQKLLKMLPIFKKSHNKMGKEYPIVPFFSWTEDSFTAISAPNAVTYSTLQEMDLKNHKPKMSQFFLVFNYSPGLTMTKECEFLGRLRKQWQHFPCNAQHPPCNFTITLIFKKSDLNLAPKLD